MTWRKSSYSGATGDDNCVEVVWRKSSYSGGTIDDNCVEVAFSESVLVRDSKNTTGPLLAFPAAAWQAFVSR